MRSNVAGQVSDRAVRIRTKARRFALGTLVAFAAAVSIGACATGHANKGDQDHVRRMAVHLTNDLGPPTDVTIYVVTNDGVRELLGDVPPNEHRAFHIPADVSAGASFRLVAERGLGRPVVSQPITATTADLDIDWSLQTNSMWFPEIS